MINSNINFNPHNPKVAGSNPAPYQYALETRYCGNSCQQYGGDQLLLIEEHEKYI
jgi:hypothetical protein